MVKRKTANWIRKSHRYLGIFLGIQFLMWTVSGLYFSWTDIDDIHGDHFKNMDYQPTAFSGLMAPSSLNVPKGIKSIEIRDINGQPYYWINKSHLYNALDGKMKSSINQDEALYVANNYVKDELKVADVKLIEEVGKHHEYREKLLPAYVISYQGADNLKAYVSAIDGKFQTVRHRDWRIFDFLWMTHTMDYEGRDDFNTAVLRAFSLLGLITVLSGFILWYISSPSLIKLKKRLKIKR
ncbi:PepSY-associated TM region [Robiginitalea myxolifaciens]|uniref:PepSY-associated TM region n=1 Tax=Robiginitalea myxolifaciens TaxID=400055 RepID=A0A1I6FVI2_9FLAO|nr:PepSY domain-containing protein [Robiginitalea myxolifaciens]SFR33931.1 PepSY-associated TM region [Robiginitalea myxolifaciens]